MKHIFIVNPAAGKSDRTAEYREMIDAAFAPRGLSYELLVSNAPGECRTLARQAAQSGEEVRLYACGGDGTLNEVVNGVVGYDNAAVTHFPGGSGNDTIKIFDDPAAFTSIERLLDAEEARFDLIRCNGSYALNVLSIGFADVTGWGEISEEQVLERNPDYIVTISMYFGEGPTPEEEILSRTGWENVTAVKNGKILNLPNNELSRPAPRLADGAKALYDFVYGE